MDLYDNLSGTRGRKDLSRSEEPLAGRTLDNSRRISEWDLVNILTAEDDGYDEHAYDAQKVAHSRSWDDIDLENTFEHRRENGLIRRKSRSWDYEDTEFSDPEGIKLDTKDLIDAAVEVYSTNGGVESCGR
jgi:hypothetical protein